MNIKDKINDRVSVVANAFVNDLPEPLTIENITNNQENQLAEQIHKSFESITPEANDYEWFLFSKNAEKFLKLSCDSIVEKIFSILPIEYNSEKENIVNWFTPWRLSDCHVFVQTQMQVPKEEQHLRSLPTTDRQICDFVKLDIMNLYDQSVIERVWKADQCSDQAFFSLLGKSIQSYIVNSTNRRVLDGSGFNTVVNVLCEMHRIGLVNLRAKGAVIECEEDWYFARESIVEMMKNCPTLLKSAYIEKRGRFIEEFTPEFDVSLSLKGTLSKGVHPNHYSRFRTRQWLGILKS